MFDYQRLIRFVHAQPPNKKQPSTHEIHGSTRLTRPRRVGFCSKTCNSSSSRSRVRCPGGSDVKRKLGSAWAPRSFCSQERKDRTSWSSKAGLEFLGSFNREKRGKYVEHMRLWWDILGFMGELWVLDGYSSWEDHIVELFVFYMILVGYSRI